MIRLAALFIIAMASVPTAAFAQDPTPTTTDTPLPTPSGDNAPPVSDLRAVTTADVLRPDGSFISPEERDYTVALTWTAPVGFAGSYEVFRLDPASGEPEQVATVPAPAGGVGGEVTYSEPIEWPLPVTCFQVRSVSASGLSPADEACTLQQPSTGPSVAPSATPAPPVTGQGVSDSQSSAPAGAMIALGCLLAGMFALSTRRGGRRAR